MLDALYETARASWPEVTVIPSADFIAYVTQRLGPEEVASARAADLYLACACSRGDARAMALFDARYMCEVERALASARFSAVSIDETKQVLRQRFLVSANDKPPRITEYSGRGDLKAWVRAAAVRAAIRVERRPKGETDVESHVFRGVAAAGDDLELDYLKRRYVVEFGEALRDAFLGLPARDRNICRYYYAEGLGIDAIGVLYRVHRSTAARWLNQITTALVEATRKRMMEKLGADRAEVASLVKMLESRIDVALRHVVETNK